jgi:hypothetical protein
VWDMSDIEYWSNISQLGKDHANDKAVRFPFNKELLDIFGKEKFDLPSYGTMTLNEINEKQILFGPKDKIAFIFQMCTIVEQYSFKNKS